MPTGAPRPAFESFVEILRHRAEFEGERRAFISLDFEAGRDPRRTEWCYAEMDRRARVVAAALQERGAAGERVLLLYPPGLDFVAGFFGCLYAGAVAVPVHPPDPARLERTLSRLAAVVGDARPHLLATTTATWGAASSVLASAPELAGLEPLATDALPPDAGSAWRDPGVAPDALALLQYTSGSTGNPKGVMVDHANLLHNCAVLENAFEETRASVSVYWLPSYHDMGLVGGIFEPVYAGFPGALMSPLDFLKKPIRWLETISREGGTTSGGPNFAFDLCVRRTTPEQREGLDLSRWRVAFNGSETVRSETIARFSAAFSPCGFRREAFYPCYGLAESTLIVSGGRPAASPVSRLFDADDLDRGRAVLADDGSVRKRRLVGSGRALDDGAIRIVEPETRWPLAPGRIGEVWHASPSVARGYWGRPEESERALAAQLADGGGRRYLRTGDLGFLHGGELFITGRMKDLIVIRGRNIAPQDVELAVGKAHANLRPGCGAAFSVEADGEERLVVAQELREEGDLDDGEVIDAIASAVASECQIAPYATLLLAPRTLPKTPNGKLCRRECRDRYREGALFAVASRGPLPGASGAIGPGPLSAVQRAG